MGQRSSFDVIGLGALNLDLIYKIPDIRILTEAFKSVKPGGEVSVEYNDFEGIKALLESKGSLEARSGGGQAANTIVSLSRLGFTTGYVGKLGTDIEGDYLFQSLEGVDKSGLIRGGKSGICLSVLGQELENRTNIISPNANDTLTYEEIGVEYLKGAKYLHMTSFIGDKPFQAQKRLGLELAEDVDITFDPNEVYTARPLKELVPIIEVCTILFVTEEEVKLLTGKGYDEGSRVLLDCGPEIVVCKRGYKGSKTFSDVRNAEFEVPANEVKVVDKTGAGDVYAAGFIAGMLLNYSLHDCAVLGTEMAGISITGYGRQNYPGKEILDTYPRKKRSYV